MKRKIHKKNSPIHRDPRSAWKHLVERGGIELRGRDEDLETELLVQLMPTAPSLDDALQRVSVDQFLQAFFATARPYVRMFEEILRFFETAGAKEGRNHWRLALVGGTDLDLDHFREQLDEWRSIKGRAELPAFDIQGAWQIRRVVFHGNFDQERQVGRATSPRTEWIGEWFREYHAGRYRLLPIDRLKAELPAEFHCIVPFISAAAQLPAERGLTREDLRKIIRVDGFRVDGALLLRLAVLAAFESDYGLGQVLESLLKAKHLPAHDRREIEQALEDLICHYPACSVEMDISVPKLDDILRLPIWQKRHELYAVWVATVIVGGLDGHDYKLHHENGRLEFAFRETRVASVVTSSPPRELLSERRSPLSKDARSDTRTEAVQPDYGIWTTGKDAVEACVLVIECKHYKQSAGGAFAEVVSDYALSLPNAHVVLASHGPIADIEAQLPPQVRRRCSSLPRLTAENGAARKALQDRVREAVGPRATATLPTGVSLGSGTVIAIDISGSMAGFLVQSSLQDRLLELVTQRAVCAVVTMDTRLAEFFPPTPAGIKAALSARGDGTELTAPLQSLANVYDAVIVITDSDGYRYLKSAPGNRLGYEDPKLYILERGKTR